jgi:hypothetical protein
MLHPTCVRMMPSSLLTRPYMHGGARSPLLPNAHLSSSDEDSEEQKKPAV